MGDALGSFSTGTRLLGGGLVWLAEAAWKGEWYNHDERCIRVDTRVFRAVTRTDSRAQCSSLCGLLHRLELRGGVLVLLCGRDALFGCEGILLISFRIAPVWHNGLLRRFCCKIPLHDVPARPPEPPATTI